MQSRKYFTDELYRLRHNILEMATKVEENLGKALAALRTRNPELAEKVREDDAVIDALQIQIEDEAAILIATQQPVARDLREMVSIFKLTGNIERIGDHAAHLARAAKKLAKKSESLKEGMLTANLPAQEHLEKMAETGRKMLRAAITAYMEQDAQSARGAAAMDAVIDAEHDELTKNILKQMKKKPDFVKIAFEMLHTSGQLERLGDHIKNICEAVIYMVEGKREELNE